MMGSHIRYNYDIICEILSHENNGFLEIPVSVSSPHTCIGVIRCQTKGFTILLKTHNFLKTRHLEDKFWLLTGPFWRNDRLQEDEFLPKMTRLFMG